MSVNLKADIKQPPDYGIQRC